MLRISSSAVRRAIDSMPRDSYLDGLTSPEAIESYCLHRFAALGYRVERTTSKFSGIRPGPKLVLGDGWDEKPTWMRARTLEHEYTHAMQRQHGAGFFARYLRPINAWIWEVQGYAAGARSMQRMGLARELVAAEFTRTPNVLWRSYPTLRIYRKSSLRDRTQQAMRAIVGGSNA